MSIKAICPACRNAAADHRVNSKIFFPEAPSPDAAAGPLAPCATSRTIADSARGGDQDEPKMTKRRAFSCCPSCGKRNSISPGTRPLELRLPRTPAASRSSARRASSTTPSSPRRPVGGERRGDPLAREAEAAFRNARCARPRSASRRRSRALGSCIRRASRFAPEPAREQSLARGPGPGASPPPREIDAHHHGIMLENAGPRCPYATPGSSRTFFEFAASAHPSWRAPRARRRSLLRMLMQVARAPWAGGRTRSCPADLASGRQASFSKPGRSGSGGSIVRSGSMTACPATPAPRKRSGRRALPAAASPRHVSS